MSNCDYSKCKPPAREVDVSGLSEAQAKVRAFHEKFEQPAPGEPETTDTVNWDRHDWRADWLQSEFDEQQGSETIADLADAYVDIIVFALGGLVELGVDGGPLFDAVMAANMTKVKLPGVAKIAKPPGFVHPDIAALIEVQRSRK